MHKKKNKPFDCVEFKRKAQARIYKDIASMSTQSQAAHFELLATQGSLGRWWKSARRKRRASKVENISSKPGQ